MVCRGPAGALLNFAYDPANITGQTLFVGGASIGKASF
jgi:hypothetical protein